MAQHRLIVDKTLIRHDFESTKAYPSESSSQYQLFYQMTRITRDKGALIHDDRLDALAIAVAYWVEQMAQDDEVQEKVRLEEEQRKAFRQWETHIHIKDFGMMQAEGISIGVGSLIGDSFLASPHLDQTSKFNSLLF